MDAAMIVAIVATQEMHSAIAQQCRSPAVGSDFDLAAELHDAVGRQLEEFHGAFRVTKHPGEQLLAPNRHPWARRGEQGLAGKEEAGVHHTALRADLLRLRERRRNVDLLHEAIAQDDPVEARTIILRLEAF